MRTWSIDAPDGPISGFEVGDGPPVVLIAGLGSTGRIWGQFPIALGRRFRVITPDNRGVGSSRDGRAFSLQGAAKDLESVLDGLDVGRAALLGASMGGLIALETALAAPDRVSRIVIASSAAHLSTHGRRLLELFRDLLLYAPPERAGSALMTLAFSPAFHERFSGFVDEATQLYGPDEADVPGALHQIEHLLRGWDLRDRLWSLRMPALVLCGDRDPVIAPEDTEELARALPRADLERITGAAHSVLAEGGEPVLNRVVRFLKG